MAQNLFALIVSTHDEWGKLKKWAEERSENKLAILIDNTTVENALKFMEEGLGESDSFHAQLIPDLSILFFAVLYYDKVFLLAHNLENRRLKQLNEIFPGVFEIVNWKEKLYYNGLSDATKSIFNNIQTVFRDRETLRNEWSAAWRNLTGIKINEPQYFNRDRIDLILDSPYEYAFNIDCAVIESETNSLFKLIFNGIEQAAEYVWPLSNDFSKEDKVAVYASYHTYRSIFYHGLSEYLNIPYLPSGIRGVGSNFLPIEHLSLLNDYLNPGLKIKFNELIKRGLRKEQRNEIYLRFEGLEVTPTLAILFERMKDYNDPTQPNWKKLFEDLRQELARSNTKIKIQEIMKAMNSQTYDYNSLVEIERQLNTSTQEYVRRVFQSIHFVFPLLESIVSQKPDKALESMSDLKDLVEANPIQLFKDLLIERPRLQFIFHAKELVEETLSLEGVCQEIWKRRFSPQERQYLTNLSKVSPIYGI